MRTIPSDLKGNIRSELTKLLPYIAEGVHVAPRMSVQKDKIRKVGHVLYPFGLR